MNMRSNIKPIRGRRSERGITLIEALVAITVFTVVFLVALMLYQVATSSYLRTDAAVIQQQNLRFTMDRVSETLRDAGAGHNMLGSKKLADEQIEGAWESAVFVRGDFDGQRENDLENSTFPIVTTGNDEIVGYVLQKPGANNYTIDIKADLTGSGRDAIYTDNTNITNEETASVSVAATTVAQQTDPPYQLVRVSFEKNSTTPKYEVLADNITKLQFHYFPASGTTEVTYGATGADTQRAERAKIRKIQVSMSAQTERRDMDFRPGGYRQLSFDETILAVNLGTVGAKHQGIPPVSLPTPDYITACNGHCRNHLIRWAPVDGVSVYRLTITAPDTGGLGTYTANIDQAGTEYEFKEPDADITAGVFRDFTFKVAATSGATIGTYTSSVTRQSANDAASVPETVQNVVGTGASGEYALDVTWDAVLTNVSPITDTTRCVSAGTMGGGSAPPSPWNQKAIDLTNSKVYRVRSDGSNNGSAATTDVSTASLGALVNAVSNTAFRDRLAAPCSAYFYRVKACDLCNVTSTDYSAPMSSPASYTVAAGVTPSKASAAPTVVGSVGNNGTNYSVQLKWNDITAASDGKPAATAHYVLERWRSLGTPDNYTYETKFDVYDAITGPVDTPLEVVSGQTAYYRYMVRGVYDCTPSHDGPLSDPYDLACTPPASNTVSITNPVVNDVFTRPTEGTIYPQLSVTGTGWTGATIVIKDQYGTPLHSETINGAPAGSFYTFTQWDIPDTVPDGQYTISATATVNACRAIATDHTFTIETAVCGQRIVNAVLKGNGGNTATSMDFSIENTCTSIVSFSKLTPTWSGVLSTVKITKVTKSATTLYSNSPGTASGGTITFSSSTALAAGSIVSPSTTSGFTLEFTDNFTSDGTKNGTFGQFSSIKANLTSPSLTTEELVDGSPIP